ncbi:hypothetical protein VPHK567_0226 [Vibrio phage K567]
MTLNKIYEGVLIVFGLIGAVILAIVGIVWSIIEFCIGIALMILTAMFGALCALVGIVIACVIYPFAKIGEYFGTDKSNSDK